MLKIFQRSTTPEIYAVTPQAYFASEATLDPAMKHLPAWFKRSAAEYKKKIEGEGVKQEYATSFHKCPGLIELYKKGFIITCPTDIFFEYSDDGQDIRWSMGANDNLFKIQLMQKEEVGLPEPESGYYRHVIKLVMPIKLLCNQLENYAYLMPVPYPDNTTFHACPGILDFDLSSDLNIQIVARSDQGMIRIKKGDPLVHIIPSNDKATILNKKIDYDLAEDIEDLSRITLNKSTLTRNWSTMKGQRLRYFKKNDLIARIQSYK